MNKRKRMREIVESWQGVTAAFTQTLLEIQQAAQAVCLMAGAVQELAQVLVIRHRQQPKEGG